MKKILQITLLFSLLFGFSSFLKAQQQTIPAEKRAVIAELVALTKIDKHINEITDTMLNSFEQTYPLIIKQTLDKTPGLKSTEREKLENQLVERQQFFSKKFRERLPQELNYNEYIEKGLYPLYDKFFTENELRDLVTFYRTPTGQKVIDTMPKLFAESMQASQRELLPKVLKLVGEIVQEEFQNVRQSPQKVNK